MKNFNKIFAIISFALITSSAFASTDFEAEISQAKKLSETSVFLDENYANQSVVDLPEMHCEKTAQSRTEVAGVADGRVHTKRLPVMAFTCTYKN